MRWRWLLAATVFLLPATAHAEAPFEGAPLSDADLTAMRGGFVLPNGIEITLAVNTVAMANGQLLFTSQANVTGETATPSIDARKGEGANGTLSVDAAGRTIRYEGSGLSITQKLGSAIGTFVQNSVDNRMIDIASAVKVTINNVDPRSLGGGALIVGRLTGDFATVRP